ncbi:UDP-N-acetylmuramoyl-tripeptide--D-alanyl-D-alanine ligase [Corynebacterium sphenisci DSM 44792]|uniref:UDP-N-acetylmuramoyl-tripeptide--D-alanyl-D-alanine ligase n=1 Tax=Corynebacterium sphenisci DSM 44792 TaxID=1437874 RepID=A0A1L7CYZ5_9CORY|nr:UDP-N-acetylmuramoyl-tripeptide--D-alanyl-D-alanine ligase [Corynebacterium sphenisci]APT90961.1 UDP-N-acetylmuramoyl-tripeptide--D-alanyl-D-alanine ligase [Corynebacterium sphenisci DSM 44792]
MIPLRAAEIAAIVGGRLHHVDPATTVTGPAEFDSRKVAPGGLFLALPGARVDGHEFAPAAAAAGAALVLAAREVDAPCCVVEPTGRPEGNSDAYAHDPDGSGAAVLAALGALARDLVDRLTPAGLTVVGVTGSAGKTSTKDMLATILGGAGPTVAPAGSFNNEIGHPYTVLRADAGTRFLVAEMSARGVGHIAHLARIAPPRIGAVLNVGTAHLGEFGSRETIAAAKGELVEALPAAAAGGVAVLNADDPLVAGMAGRTAARVLTFSAAGDPAADLRATGVVLDELARASFTLHDGRGGAHPVRLRVHGAHQVANALAAAAVAIAAGIDPAAAAAALSGHAAASAHRMDVRTRADGVTVINDSYNANPDSMRAGIAALARTAAARDGAAAVAVLGEMGELGEAAVAEHRALGEALAEAGVDALVAVGDSPAVRALAEAAAGAGITSVSAGDRPAAVRAAARILRPGDAVLVKASYADGLWRVAEGLLDEGLQDEGA